MITVYDLLEIEENASQEEIAKAYEKLLIEYHKDPKLSVEENNDREIILNKLKLAYDILSNEEKRKKYDNELAKKRAEELIKNVSFEREKNSEEIVDEKKEQIDNDKSPEIVQNENITNSSNSNTIKYEEEHEENEKAYLTEEEKKKLKKAAQKEFKTNLKKAQKAEEEYNRAYNEAYNDYLRKLGYTVKEPWTFKRIKNLIIFFIAIIIFIIIVWSIPFTRNLLIQIYEENFIIKSLVDIISMLFNAIISAFKK